MLVIYWLRLPRTPTTALEKRFTKLYPLSSTTRNCYGKNAYGPTRLSLGINLSLCLSTNLVGMPRPSLKEWIRSRKERTAATVSDNHETNEYRS